MKKIIIWSIALVLLVNAGCKDDDVTETEVADTEVNIHFNHFVNGLPVEMDTMKYYNANGDTFSMRTIKYFITRLTFHRSGKDNIVLSDMHYVEHAIPETEDYTFATKIPSGNYTSVSFTYGFIPTENISLMFGVPPENQMFWPENMGGGYHYQKLEGQYYESGEKRFFNFHSGGLDKVDYSINVPLPNSSFATANNEVNIELEMEIMNWFNSPVVWDFAYFGPAIMENHEAQETIQKNGVDVFTATIN